MPTPPYFYPFSGQPTPVSPADTEPQQYFLARVGDRDLSFLGWLIGHAKECRDVQGEKARCVSVSLFATESDNLVAFVCRWREGLADDGTIAVERTDLECSTLTREASYPSMMLAWLMEDAGRKLGPTSKVAWEQACENWEILADARFERV